MRKIIAVALAVLMLVSVLAALPVFAAEETYDGTTKETAGLNQIFISEISAKTSYRPDATTDTTLYLHQNAFNFIELYNNSDSNVDLTTLSLLRAVRYNLGEPNSETDPYLEECAIPGIKYWELWREYYKFTSKIDIKSGKIVDDAVAGATGAFEDVATDEVYQTFFTNEGKDTTLASGKTAVIWFVGPETYDWMKETKLEIEEANAELPEADRVTFNPTEYFIKSFYGAEANVADYTVLMVWAWSDNDPAKTKPTPATDMFVLETIPEVRDIYKDYIFGVAQNTWNLENDVAYDVEAGTNNKLYSMTVVGMAIPLYNGGKAEMSVTFAPSTTVPHVANANEKMSAIGTPEVFTDYFDAGYVKSYRETGVINWVCDPTPGTLPAWQSALIDPNYPNAQTVIDEYLKELKLYDDGTSTGQDESGIDRNYNFQLQEDLKNQFYNNNKKTQNEEGGLSTVVLILIIAGGVLAVAGAACAVVFLVVLPKKKAAAAAAVDAPVAEAPTEEAPVAEDKKEE